MADTNDSITAVVDSLHQLHISALLIRHDAVMNCDEHDAALKQHLTNTPNLHLIKNLFVKDKKSNYYLFVVPAESAVPLKQAAKAAGCSGDVRFADAAKLQELLGVAQGSVTPLAVSRDTTNAVRVIIDQSLTADDYMLGVHPNTNTATVSLSYKQLETYLLHYNHPPQVVDFAAAAGDAAAAQTNGTSASGKPTKPAKADKAAKGDKPAKADKAAKSEKPVKSDKTAKDSDVSTSPGMDKDKLTQFSGWYSQVVIRAELIDYYDISGCFILRPYSYAMWELITKYFDTEIKKLGVKNSYFPMFVSESALATEESHLEGFSAEVAWVTESGGSKLDRRIAIRPTSETIMYPQFARWIRSHRDLPLKLNQWTNVVRWEFKYPTPFIRTREFLWQEGHTAYSSLADADKEVLDILDLYASVYETLLAVPVIKGRKTELEKFAGGAYTTTVEAFIPAVGRGVQGATSHHLGTNFAKMFNIQYLDEKNNKQYVFQNSWGLTTRTIGVCVMVHGDNTGLILPPNIAPVQVVIVPITFKDPAPIIAVCQQVESALLAAGIRAECDLRDNFNPGNKFHHHELRGVPLRIEIGPNDISKQQVSIQRRDQSKDQKFTLPIDDQLSAAMVKQLNTMQHDMYNKAKTDMLDRQKRATTWTNFMAALNERCTALSPHCETNECETALKKRSAADSVATDDTDDSNDTSAGAEKLERLTGAAKSLCIPLAQPELASGTKCVQCGETAKNWTLFGRSY